MKRLYRATATITAYFLADPDADGADPLAWVGDDALAEEIDANGIESGECRIVEVTSVAGIAGKWRGGIAWGDNPDNLTCEGFLAQRATTPPTTAGGPP